MTGSPGDVDSRFRGNDRGNGNDKVWHEFWRFQYDRRMNKTHLSIITGASRGLGLALAQALIDQGHRLLCISRNASSALQERAAQRGAHLEQWTLDLSQASEAAQRLETWLAAQDASQLASATLINNAASLPRIAPLSEADPAELSRVLRSGLEAPMLLSSAFLRATQAWPASANVERKVLNISSGLARRAMASQAGYCAIKAGMDHFTRCVALEEALKAHGAKLCSLAPGVIDTDMQITLRASTPEQFPDLATFQGMKDKGLLSAPFDTARALLSYLARPDFGKEPVADIRG